ncbi:ABC transporter permease [Catellatospora tritici]|uniref:ABC transporter permease n=1 Tax=Catellatospora tritici TaxID=2851566 RepID=UPI001C2CEC75|nr:ABC transporter permease [Catellatospora tritici]MBV1849157.1 ABC transporter permease [Catellatospora tritici]
MTSHEPLEAHEPVGAEPPATASSPDKSPAKETPVFDQYTVTADEPPVGHHRAAEPAKRSFGQVLREELWADNSVTVTILAIVLALFCGGIFMIVGNAELREQWSYFFYQPGKTLAESWDFVSTAYGDMFKGSIVNPDTANRWYWNMAPWQQVFYPITETLTYAAPLIFTGLAVAVPFRAGLFNIGGQGQAVMGAIGGGTVGLALSTTPWVQVPLGLIAGALLGGLYGYLVGVLKARTGAHEVILTIMLNNIAFLFLGWYILQEGIKDPNRPDAISKPIAASGYLPKLIPDPLLRANLGIILAVLTAAGVAWLLKRGRFGFELRAVGHNPSAAATAGIGVGTTLALTMALAGALAGLGGTAVALGTAPALTGDMLGQIGFNGILVALLGRVRPWGVVGAGLLFGALQAGGNTMQNFSGVSQELVFVIQALIVLFVAAPALVKTIYRLRRSPAAAAQAALAKG